jgi:hypothetical protein
MLARFLSSSLILALSATPAWADPENAGPSAVVTLGADEYLSAGADAIRAQQYDDGIRLTLIGLERGVSPRNRAAGLANLCAAHVARNEPDQAIPYCTESLSLNGGNWRTYSNRSQAYLLKGMYAQAAADNEAASAINPGAAHVRMMKGLLNERMLQPSITIEEHH